jgi:hypothetical protein
MKRVLLVLAACGGSPALRPVASAPPPVTAAAPVRTDTPAAAPANEHVADANAFAKRAKEAFEYFMAIEYPKAVAACACANMDVDAFELFTLETIAGGTPHVTEGFLAYPRQ